MRRHYINDATVVALTGAINNSVTSCVITDASTMPATTPWTAVIDAGLATAEVVLVTAVVGTTLTVTRGYDGSAAQAHANGAAFAHVAVKADYDEANSHVNATSGVHGVVGAVVGDTDAQTLTNKTLSSATVTGNLPVSGNVTAVNVTASGDLAVTGNATVAGNTAVTGNVTVTGTVAASNFVPRSSVIARRSDSSPLNSIDSTPTHVALYDVSTTVAGTDITFASGIATIVTTGQYRWGAGGQLPTGTAVAGFEVFVNGTAITYGAQLTQLSTAHRLSLTTGDVLPLTAGDTLQLGVVCLDGTISNVFVRSFTVTREA